MYHQWVEKNRGKSGADKVVVEMSQWFSDLIQNVVCRMLLGKRYWGDEEERVRFQKVIREPFGFLGMFLVADAFPLLRCLDLGGHEKAMKRTAKETDSMLEKWLEEHKQKRDSGMMKGEQDFMDVMLANFTDNRHGYDADTIIKATSMELFSAGADTSSSTVEWALAELIKNPDSMKKVREELAREIINQDGLKECLSYTSYKPPLKKH